jgi:putative component of membrane protein insertase Oxa1/YidC/SpoIIIJ protein YidD
MKPLQLFREQPVWASLLVLLSYLILGPYMQDDRGHIERPQPLMRDRWLVLGSWLLLTFIGLALFNYLGWSKASSIIASTLTSILLTLVALGKPVVRILVNLYQRRAPSEIRLLCPQSPSCSDYFLISVNKYGVLRGGYRGWCRLRCCDGTTYEKLS